MRLFVIATILTVAVSDALAEKRVALVIGNSDYEHTGRLKNPTNDAALFAKTLQGLGFEIIQKKNLGIKPMKRAIQAFIGRLVNLGPETVGLVYYAGHGVQVGGLNYLLPVDAKIEQASDVDIEAVSANALMSGMRHAKNRLNIIIFDACRSNPYRSLFRDPVRGLARMDAPAGSYVVFATSPGDVAYDGDGANSPFTEALSKHIATPGLKVEDVIKRVGRDVLKSTEGKQRPWLSSAVYEDFYPAGAGAGAGLKFARPQLGKLMPKVAAVTAPPKPEAETLVKPTVGVYSEKTKDVEPEMLRIPSGTFQMGCFSGKGCEGDQKPVRSVAVNAFEIGKYEVTFDEWDACADDGGCKHKPRDNGWGRGERPVFNVSWEDITKEYLPWLNRKTGKQYRLPSEAEWEYAARAGSTTAFWWGTRITTDQANYNGNFDFHGVTGEHREKTIPVDSFKANAFGLHNVHGNVMEILEDCSHKNYKNAPNDSSPWLFADGGKCRDRAVRGGSWYDAPQNLRSSHRGWIHKRFRSILYGFRIARSLADLNPQRKSKTDTLVQPVVGVFASKRSYRSGDTLKDCDVCPEMVVVPSGSFMMGDASGGTTKPVHPVTIAKPFAVGKFEVTFDEWDACVADGGCTGYKPKDEGWGRGKRPVIHVSWGDANTYIQWINSKVDGSPYKLLSEAEWEYVTRAGTTTKYTFGDKISKRHAQHNTRETIEVGSFKPNAFGVYDVHGNVCEWVEDCYHKNYKGAPADGSAWLAPNGGHCDTRVLRGGSWSWSGLCASGSGGRSWKYETARDKSLGFRVSRKLKP